MSLYTLGGQNNSQATNHRALLSFDVRYALQHRKGVICTDDVLTLARSDFYGMAIYFAARALNENQDSQWALIEDTVNHFLSGKGGNGIDALVKKYLVNGNQKIEGAEAAHVSRIGPQLIEQKFEEIAREAYQKGNVPVLISYAALMGLKPFVEHMSDGDELFLVTPLKYTNGQFLGFQIKRTQERVQTELLTQSSLFDLEKITLVDDVAWTGDTLKDMIFYWNRIGRMPGAIDLRCIDMVNRNGLAQSFGDLINQGIMHLPETDSTNGN